MMVAEVEFQYQPRRFWIRLCLFCWLIVVFCGVCLLFAGDVPSVCLTSWLLCDLNSTIVQFDGLGRGLLSVRNGAVNCCVHVIMRRC